MFTRVTGPQRCGDATVSRSICTDGIDSLRYSRVLRHPPKRIVSIAQLYSPELAEYTRKAGKILGACDNFHLMGRPLRFAKTALNKFAYRLKGHFHYGCAALRFAALRCDSQR